MHSFALETADLSQPIHDCFSTNGLSERCRFCKICGIYMPRPQSLSFGSTVNRFYRSPRFALVDPTGANSNTILEQMIARQSINRYYNVSVYNIKHRKELIGWMQGTCQDLSYSLATFYLSVAYLDAIFSLYIVKENQLKLIGYLSIYLAAKMEEEDSKIPTLKQMVKLFKEEFSVEEIINCEKFMCKILGFSMNLKTPFSFLMFFFSKGFVSTADLQNLTSADGISKYVENLEKLALFFLDLSSKHYEFYQFTSIAVAATAIACARKCAGVSSWSIDLEKLTFISWESIKDCSQMVLSCFKEGSPSMYREFFPNGHADALPEIFNTDVSEEEMEFDNDAAPDFQSHSNFNQELTASQMHANLLTPLPHKNSDNVSTDARERNESALNEELSNDLFSVSEFTIRDEKEDFEDLPQSNEMQIRFEQILGRADNTNVREKGIDN